LFKVFTHILINALIKRKRYVILPNYPNQLLIYFHYRKNNTLEVMYSVLIEGYNWKEKVIIALKIESDIHFETIFG